MRTGVVVFAIFFWGVLPAQTVVVGSAVADGRPLSNAVVEVLKQNQRLQTDSLGLFSFTVAEGSFSVRVSHIGFMPVLEKLNGKAGDTLYLDVTLRTADHQLNEVVVSGALKEMRKAESALPMDVYTAKYFERNRTNNLHETLRLVNGVQANIDNNVSGAGDIEINGNEGQYTLVLVDGMPLMQGMRMLWAASAFPTDVIERIEVLKGPASTAYGSDGIAGVVNIITTNPFKRRITKVEAYTTSYLETTANFLQTANLGKLGLLLNVNYFNQPMRWDLNKDNFTDVPLSDRVNVQAKVALRRKDKRIANISGRFMYENRWGGEMNWHRSLEGSDSVYAQVFKTYSGDVWLNYQLPLREKFLLKGSFTHDLITGWFGNYRWAAQQESAFGQLSWEKTIGSHYLLMGTAFRLLWFDDNHLLTANYSNGQNTKRPLLYQLPGVFAGYEFSHNGHLAEIGGRYEYDTYYGNHVFSPRLNYRYLTPNKQTTVRVGLGSAYRVPTIFNDEFNALSSGRRVELPKPLKAETSWGATLNATHSFNTPDGILDVDGSLFYNIILHAVESNFDKPGVIEYENAELPAHSRGLSLSGEFSFRFPLRVNVGFILSQFYFQEEDSSGEVEQEVPVNYPNFYLTFGLSYSIPNTGLTVDWTGNVLSPMHLAVQPNDYRPSKSNWMTIQNIQLRQQLKYGFEVFAGVQNLFNYRNSTPIMRPQDPFNRHLNDNTSNPGHNYFDASYTYAPVQGIKGQLGIRWSY